MLEAALKQYFGFEHFRTGQKEVIASLLNEQDSLAVLPTGTGKSLCYQLTGYLREGLVLVVSPLISLMEDQVSSLQRMGEKRVIALNGTLQVAEKNFVLQNLSRYKFLFLSPEMLLQESVLKQLRLQKIALFVVDEAHCVSQWGVDFRPEYRNLGVAKAQLGLPVTLALTASATKVVRNEISEILLKQPAKSFVYSMDRPNITLLVRQTDQKLADLKQVLAQTKGSGIIYCATRKQVEYLYNELSTDYAIGYYHGGLETSQRRILQQQFLDNQLQFLIATNAFGMGINKEDIRLVVHYELPETVENYMQEIGRAGRNGQQSTALLFYHTGDERIHHFLQKNVQDERELFELRLQQKTLNSLSELQEKWLQQTKREGVGVFLAHLEKNESEKQQKLQQMLAFIHYKGCRRQFLLSYFEEWMTDFPEACCDYHGAELLDESENFQEVYPTNLSWQEILLKMFKEKI